MLNSLFFKKTPRSLSEINAYTPIRSLFKIYDVFYLCYDEPNRQENWRHLQSILPKAKKVEGIVGFDKALKTCASQSKTPYFFLIDGDNQLIESRLDAPLGETGLKNHWVLSWSSMNQLNGLAYGNGGLKLWPKEVALNINTHENAKSEDATDYCFLADYYMLNDFMSHTVVNKTPEQAFRAGLREGFKMTLVWGEQFHLDKHNFNKVLGGNNRARLKIWCEVGADVPNGLWAILGARLGFKLNVLDRVDSRVINSYQSINDLLTNRILQPLRIDAENLAESEDQIQPVIESLGRSLNSSLGMELRLLSPKESVAFKKAYQNPNRRGLLIPSE